MNDQAVVLRLEKQNDRSDEFRRFESSLRELVQVLTDLLSRQEDKPEHDMAGAMIAAMSALKLPAPQVSVSTPTSPDVIVHPTTIAPAGTQWKIDYTRTPKGGQMIVTKL